jgi:hypothetical protein
MLKDKVQQFRCYRRGLTMYRRLLGEYCDFASSLRVDSPGDVLV